MTMICDACQEANCKRCPRCNKCGWRIKSDITPNIRRKDGATMRTFEQLSEPEQGAAVDHCLALLLQEIIEGALRLNDDLNGDGLQAAIDAAIVKAGDMQTSWFAGEYIMEARYFPGKGHDTEDDGLWPVAETLRSMAQCDAEDTSYAGVDDGPIVRLTGTLADGFKVVAA